MPPIDVQATPEDDGFHAPTSPDPYWNETAWFTWMVPERKLYCYIYPWLRANLGITGGGVMIWDDRGRHPWEAVHWNYEWNQPFSEPGDLRNVTFPQGVRMQCLEPLTRYRLSYEHPDCSFDLVYEALLEPHAVRAEGGAQADTFAGHLDQQGHVTGSLALLGEHLDVDCYGIRDRSWGRRVPSPGLHMGYDIATGPATGLIAFSFPEQAGREIVGGTGYLWHDGRRSPLAAGRRTIERDGMWPTSVVIEATDGLEREVHAVAHVENQMAFQNTPWMMNIVCLVRWELHGPDGGTTEVWGEIEDVWDVEIFRRFVRALPG
jgi:hypothetical protein